MSRTVSGVRCRTVRKGELSMPQSKEGKRYLRSALALAVAGAFAAMHPAWADVPELETNSDGAYINVTAGDGYG